MNLHDAQMIVGILERFQENIKIAYELQSRDTVMKEYHYMAVRRRKLGYVPTLRVFYLNGDIITEMTEFGCLNYLRKTFPAEAYVLRNVFEVIRGERYYE